MSREKQALDTLADIIKPTVNVEVPTPSVDVHVETPSVDVQVEPVNNVDVQPTIRFSPTFRPNVNVQIVQSESGEILETKVEVEEHEPLEKSIDNYLIENKPYYQVQNGEDTLFRMASKNNIAVMLKGPTGCGKTRFVEYMAHKLKRPLVTVNCQEDISAADLTGRHLLNQDGTYWVDGPLTKAARYGGICYLDEVVEARNDVMVLIHSLTDHRRILPLERNDELIEAHENFMLVISYNPNYQTILKDMKESTRQRFVSLDFDYLNPELETNVVRYESKVSKARATRLVDFGNKTRKLKEKGDLKEGASTRLLVYAGMLIKGSMDPYQAIGSIAGTLTDDPSLAKKIVGMYKEK